MAADCLEQRRLMGPWVTGPTSWITGYHMLSWVSNSRVPNDGSQVLGPSFLSPKCWVSHAQVLNCGTHKLGPEKSGPNTWDRAYGTLNLGPGAWNPRSQYVSLLWLFFPQLVRNVSMFLLHTFLNSFLCPWNLLYLQWVPLSSDRYQFYDRL